MNFTELSESRQNPNVVWLSGCYLSSDRLIPSNSNRERIFFTNSGFAFAQCGSTLFYNKTKIVCSCIFSAEEVRWDDIAQLGYLYSKRRLVEIKETLLNG